MKCFLVKKFDFQPPHKMWRNIFSVECLLSCPLKIAFPPSVYLWHIVYRIFNYMELYGIVIEYLSYLFYIYLSSSLRGDSGAKTTTKSYLYKQHMSTWTSANCWVNNCFPEAGARDKMEPCLCANWGLGLLFRILLGNCVSSNWGKLGSE